MTKKRKQKQKLQEVELVSEEELIKRKKKRKKKVIRLLCCCFCLKFLVVVHFQGDFEHSLDATSSLVASWVLSLRCWGGRSLRCWTVDWVDGEGTEAVGATAVAPGRVATLPWFVVTFGWETRAAISLLLSRSCSSSRSLTSRASCSSRSLLCSAILA